MLNHNLNLRDLLNPQYLCASEDWQVCSDCFAGVLIPSVCICSEGVGMPRRISSFEICEGPFPATHILNISRTTGAASGSMIQWCLSLGSFR